MRVVVAGAGGVTGPGRFYALGDQRQYIYVAPDANAVVVRLGACVGGASRKVICQPVADAERCSSLALSRCAFFGSCFRACRRMTRGTRSLPSPRPSNSRAIVTCDRSPPSSGSIVPLAIATAGPPAPRTVHVWGAFSSVISSVLWSARGPTRRVTTAR